jgi:glucosylglycerate synthase
VTKEKTMATSNQIGSTADAIGHAGAYELLIGIAGPADDGELRSRSTEALSRIVASGTHRIAVASPISSQAEAASAPIDSDSGLQFLSYPLSASAAPSLPWLAAPAAYREIARLAVKTGARACVILSPDFGALNAVEALAQPIIAGQAQLSAPIYPIGKYEGLLNSGILYPFIRALYGRQIRHPFAVDFGIGGSMLSQLATETTRDQGSALLCPVIGSAVAGVPIAQSHLDIKHVHHDGIDLSTVLTTLAGAIFEDAEKNAATWQRMRGSQATHVFGSPLTVSDGEDADVRPLIESFVLASRNLQEIWGLVLPPVVLLELKRMARLPVEQFRMPDPVWAKIVYDFALAYRLRSISRNHLLGALTPLYLGWVASYIAEVQSGDAIDAEHRIEKLALAFEQTKPYFVSRWRWPDRFNP